MARTKLCDFCNGEYEPDYIQARNGYCLWMDVKPWDNTIDISAQANDEDGFMIEESISVPMNYCPKCGRKLTG